MTTKTVSAADSLLVMGDSLSAAYRLPPEKGWVSLLERQLLDTHPNIKVVNASVSGETTQGGLARFEAIINQHHPRWVIIELGANDGLRGYPLFMTERNLGSMVRMALANNAEVLLLGNRIPQNYGKRYTERFFDLYRRVAEKYQVAYMPFMLENVALDRKLMQSDRLHPNAKAQTIILKDIWPYLKPLLEKS